MTSLATIGITAAARLNVRFRPWAARVSYKYRFMTAIMTTYGRRSA